jgi:proteic killer suppression protein
VNRYLDTTGPDHTNISRTTRKACAVVLPERMQGWWPATGPARTTPTPRPDRPNPATVAESVRLAYRYGLQSKMIRSFRHKGLQAYFERGTKAGIQTAHASKLGRLLARLDQAQAPQDINLPGWGPHPLHGNLTDHWAVSVNGNWRVTFTFEGTDAVLLNYLDYH